MSLFEKLKLMPERIKAWRGLLTCGRQRRGCWGTAWGVLEAGESLCRWPSADILGSCQPCRWLGPNSTGTCNHSCRSQIAITGLNLSLNWSHFVTSLTLGEKHHVLLVHRVVKPGDSLMSPVLPKLRQNVTKHIWSVGRKRDWIKAISPLSFPTLCWSFSVHSRMVLLRQHNEEAGI